MIRLLSGDCRDVLPTLPAESVQCVVTSPPYYGLRDYGTALWDGGDVGCDHSMAIGEGDPVPPSCRQCRKCGRLSRTKWLTASTVRSECDQCGITTDYSDVDSRGTWVGVKRDADGEWALPSRRLPGRLCRCGAVRVDRQIGLETTPEEYLATMVGVFREVRRVLRRDGTCWVNMGDSYASSTGSAGASLQSTLATRPTAAKTAALREQGSWSRNVGMARPKDLLMMPARLALALQADGWWVRSDIIWHKPNPMPESVTDRPTSAHEHVFLLTRSSRYYYDADAVREEAEYGRSECRGDTFAGLGGIHAARSVTPGNGGSRNLRNVWTIATSPYPNAHFATYPAELAERCIKAGTSERGCCAACGKPWGRIGDKALVDVWHRNLRPTKAALDTEAQEGGDQASRRARDGHVSGHAVQFTTTGWSAGCQCGTTETRPCVVLDPFIGAGTTALVADRLQRDCIGVDLNVAYTEMAMERCRADAPLFTAFPPAEPPEDERMADLFAGDEYERSLPSPKPLQVPRGWDTGPGAHGTIHRTGRTISEAAD